MTWERYRRRRPRNSQTLRRSVYNRFEIETVLGERHRLPVIFVEDLEAVGPRPLVWSRQQESRIPTPPPPYRNDEHDIERNDSPLLPDYNRSQLEAVRFNRLLRHDLERLEDRRTQNIARLELAHRGGAPVMNRQRTHVLIEIPRGRNAQEVWDLTNEDGRWTFMGNFQNLAILPVRNWWFSDDLEVTLEIWVYVSREGGVRLIVTHGMVAIAVRETRSIWHAMTHEDRHAVTILAAWLIILMGALREVGYWDDS